MYTSSQLHGAVGSREEDQYTGLTERARSMLAPPGKTGFGVEAAGALAARRAATAKL
jgi:hypothetical protein